MRDAAVPAAHGEGEVARVALGGPRQEAALVAALLQQRLRLDPVDVRVEPSAKIKEEELALIISYCGGISSFSRYV